MEDFSESPVLKKVLQTTVDMAVLAFKFSVQREGLTYSNDLLNSIKAGAVTQAKSFIQGSVYYSELLRVKDMKNLNYSTIPPLAPLLKWVEKVGVGSFAFVPGYPAGIKPADYTNSIYRIAEGIRWKLKATPNVKRGYRGVYNDPLKQNVLPHFYATMREFAILFAQQTCINEFGVTPVNLFQDFNTGVNPARLQAGWNARVTKLERKYKMNNQF